MSGGDVFCYWRFQGLHRQNQLGGTPSTTTPGRGSRSPKNYRYKNANYRTNYKNVPRPMSRTQARLQDRVNSHRGSRTRRSAVRSSAIGRRPSQPKATPLTNFKPIPLMNFKNYPPKKIPKESQEMARRTKEKLDKNHKIII